MGPSSQQTAKEARLQLCPAPTCSLSHRQAPRLLCAVGRELSGPGTLPTLLPTNGHGSPRETSGMGGAGGYRRGIQTGRARGEEGWREQWLQFPEQVFTSGHWQEVEGRGSRTPASLHMCCYCEAHFLAGWVPNLM